MNSLIDDIIEREFYVTRDDIRALIEYIKAAEAWLHETHPGEQLACDQRLENARIGLRLKNDAERGK